MIGLRLVLMIDDTREDFDYSYMEYFQVNVPNTCCCICRAPNLFVMSKRSLVYQMIEAQDGRIIIVSS